jgi:hypothetical protein
MMNQVYTTKTQSRVDDSSNLEHQFFNRWGQWIGANSTAASGLPGSRMPGRKLFESSFAGRERSPA